MGAERTRTIEGAPHVGFDGSNHTQPHPDHFGGALRAHLRQEKGSGCRCPLACQRDTTTHRVAHHLRRRYIGSRDHGPASERYVATRCGDAAERNDVRQRLDLSRELPCAAMTDRLLYGTPRLLTEPGVSLILT